MLFRVRKGEVWVPDGATLVAGKPRNIDHQFDLATTDRKYLEDPRLVAELDDATRPATRTLQRVRMNLSIEGRLVQKTTFSYCTPGTPNV
jgi:hypothetical protein